jgi:hypothetical protein
MFDANPYRHRPRVTQTCFVTPAQAGVLLNSVNKIPAFAGMTKNWIALESLRDSGNDEIVSPV